VYLNKGGVLKLKILFIHQNFPGQFRHLAPALSRLGHEVHGLGITPQQLAGVTVHQYSPRRSSSPNVHPLASEFETKVIRGEACMQALKTLAQAQAGQRQAFVPELIVAHPGWGESLYVKDLYPDVPLLGYLEFHYALRGADVGFDPEFGAQPTPETSARLRSKNAHNWLAFEPMQAALCPTHWQASMLPRSIRDKTSVIFDGVDTQRACPNPRAEILLEESGAKFRAGEEIITFVNRNLEPYRGYHIFMRALPSILKARPKARVLIVGGDQVSYGGKAPEGKTWKDIFFNEVKDQLDTSRVFFLGRVPNPVFIKLLQVSACHVYLTYPFVLSWSCIESLAAGCAVVASGTEPVREVIRDQDNGLLVDFFDIQGLASRVIEVLAQPERFQAMRERARADAVARFDLASVCLPAQLRWLSSQIKGL